MVDPGALQETVYQFTDFLLRYFVALAAVGSLAMAIIELWKKVRASQTRYHARTITAWFRHGEHAFDASRLTGDEQRSTRSARAAYSELLQLTTGVEADTAEQTAGALWERGGVDAGPIWVRSRADYALFALPFERMMGHVQDAADNALNNPQRYPSLYLFITSGASADDVVRWFREADAMPDGERFERTEAKARADLYARLHQLARRKIDGFQVYAGQRWVNWNQLWANVVGIVVLFLALIWARETADASDRLALPAIVLLSLAGGMLSPVAKDVVMMLQRVRSG